MGKQFAVLAGPKGYAFRVQILETWDLAIQELQHQYEQIEEWLIGESEEQYTLNPEPPVYVNGVMESFTVRHNGTLSEYCIVAVA